MNRLDADINVMSITKQAKYRRQWKREGKCLQCGRKRGPDSTMHCPPCRLKYNLRARGRYLTKRP